MKKINFLLFLFFMISSTNEIRAQQTLSYTKCVLINAGSATDFNYHKTFTSVLQATSDVQLVVSFLACSPYSSNTAGIKLSGTTFIEANVPAGNCSYVNTTYTIDKNVFNQAVTAGSGSITFDFYVRDQCASGYGCSYASDPCIKINLTVDTTCVPTTGTATVTSCGPYTWIDGNTYSSNNNTATHVLANAGGCDSTVKLNLTIGDFQAPVPDQTQPFLKYTHNVRFLLSLHQLQQIVVQDKLLLQVMFHFHKAYKKANDGSVELTDGTVHKISRNRTSAHFKNSYKKTATRKLQFF